MGLSSLVAIPFVLGTLLPAKGYPAARSFIQKAGL
jgi:hypothetical protein